jgi:DNA polymerase III subunit gamma/tau
MPSATVPHQALYRRWRAQKFGQMVGQEAVVATLRNGARTGRLAHGLLFVGPRGTGKTSMARIVAKAVNCLAPIDGEPCDVCEPCVAIREGRALDVVELDAASNNTVQDMRDLLPRVYTAPADMRRKVFIIDEVQRITQGWDVLLKTLEEPPDDVLFIFCTTNPAQIRPAVVSRLQRYPFRPLTVAEITGKLRTILEAEGQAADPEAVDLVAQLAAGGMRDAESMLDQLLSGGQERLTADGVRQMLGLAEAASLDRFLEAVVVGDALTGIVVLDELESGGRDLSAFVDQLVARLHDAIVARLRAASPTTSGGEAASGGSVRGATLAGGSGWTGAPLTTLTGLARRVATPAADRRSSGARFALELLLLETAASTPNTVSAPGAVASATAELPTSASVRTRTPEEAPSARSRRGRLASDAKVDPGSEASDREPQPVKAPDSKEVDLSTEGVTPGRDRAPVPQAIPDAAAAMPDPTPAAADTTPATGPTAPTGADDALRRLRQGWPALMAHVGHNPANRPLIEACRPVEVHDHVVVLGFPEEQGFYRDIAERKKRVLEEGVDHVLGPGFAVRCVLANLEALEPLPAEAGGQDLMDAFREIFAGDVADIVEIG